MPKRKRKDGNSNSKKKVKGFKNTEKNIDSINKEDNIFQANLHNLPYTDYYEKDVKPDGNCYLVEDFAYTYYIKMFANDIIQYDDDSDDLD